MLQLSDLPGSWGALAVTSLTGCTYPRLRNVVREQLLGSWFAFCIVDPEEL